MNIMARCIRCGRETSVESDEYLEWEAILDGDPDSDKMICSGCVTGREQQQIDDDSEQAEVDADAERAGGHE